MTLGMFIWQSLIWLVLVQTKGSDAQVGRDEELLPLL